MANGGVLTLLLLCIAMGITSFAVGMIPLNLTLSQTNIRRLSSVSMGILMGTALIVVIPEGVDVLYNVGTVHQQQQQGNNVRRASAMIKRHESGAQESARSVGTGYVGAALAAGFILMYLIDQLPRAVPPSARGAGYSTISLHSMRSFSDSSGDATAEGSGAIGKSPLSIGLIIHAAADGVALGAASSSDNTPLELIIFFSLALHKAPVALGFAALIKNSHTKRQARANLLVFAAASPVAALVTRFFVFLISRGAAVDRSSMMWWTGILLLFSGGTFLYVAIHSMQENSSHGHDISNEEDSQAAHDEKTSLVDIVLVVGGMVLPFALQFGGHHH